MAQMEQMDEFEQAFSEDPSTEVTEDMVETAEGLVPDEVPTQEAEEVAEPDEVMDTAPVEEVAQADEDEPTDEKELQRKRSWEGRLRAREAELKAREEAAHLAEKQDSPPQGDKAEAMEQAVEKLEDGADVNEVLSQMAEDFGEDFASKLSKLIRFEAKRIAQEEAKSSVGQMSKTVEDLMMDIRDTKTRAHFEAIADKHPDFLDIAAGEEMQAYMGELSADEQAEAQRIVDAGSAREVIKLLDAVKATKKPKVDTTDEIKSMADAAEGVRSRGLALPEKPKANSYEDAWNEF